MNEKSKALENLKIVIDDFQNEYVELKKHVTNIDFELQEKERFLLSFMENETIDFKMFSPRNVESVHKEEMEEKRKEINHLEEEKKTYYRKMGFLSGHINKLNLVYENILSDGNDDFTIKESVENKYIKQMEKYSEEKINYRVLVMDMLEKERQRIARELHDSTIQEMVHVIHVLELAQKFSAQDPIRGKMELMSASKEIRNTIENIRNVIFDLRPMLIDDLGYTETLNRLKFHLEKVSDMKVELSIEDISIKNTMSGLVLYRIIQECCINAIKHSKGTKVSISLHCKEDMVFLKIIDNGIGFEVNGIETTNTNNFGLEMTKERVNLLEGTMEVESEKDIGTSIFISFSKNKLMN